jgi:AraC-like DNA-binding protein
VTLNQMLASATKCSVSLVTRQFAPLGQLAEQVIQSQLLCLSSSTFAKRFWMSFVATPNSFHRS